MPTFTLTFTGCTGSTVHTVEAQAVQLTWGQVRTAMCKATRHFNVSVIGVVLENNPGGRPTADQLFPLDQDVPVEINWKDGDDEYWDDMGYTLSIRKVDSSITL